MSNISKFVIANGINVFCAGEDRKELLKNSRKGIDHAIAVLYQTRELFE